MASKSFLGANASPIRRTGIRTLLKPCIPASCGGVPTAMMMESTSLILPDKPARSKTTSPCSTATTFDSVRISAPPSGSGRIIINQPIGDGTSNGRIVRTHRGHDHTVLQGLGMDVDWGKKARI